MRFDLCLLVHKESEDEHDEVAATAGDDDDDDDADEPEPSMIQGTDALMTVVDMRDNSLAAEAEAGENDD